MIYYFGIVKETSPKIAAGSWQDFTSWIDRRTEVEFDIETPVTKNWCERKVITAQFGDMDNQWVFQWSELAAVQKEYIKHILENNRWKKIIHRALFECVVMLFHDIRIVNVFDTLLAEKVLYGGEQNMIGYGLDDLCLRRLNIILDKSLQTAFGDNILTPGKIMYAAQDVTYLSILKKDIYQECQSFGLEWTVALECEVVLAFSEMVYHGMDFDQVWWAQLHQEVDPLVGAANEKLNHWLKQPPFLQKALQLGYIAEEDRILINWNSPKQKKFIFSSLFAELPGTTSRILEKYLSDKILHQQEYPEWLAYYIHGDHSELTKYLLTNERQWLIDNHLLIPTGTCTINWNSVAQVLPIIQCVEKVKNLSDETLGRTTHPIIIDYQDYKDTIKLVDTYGIDWSTKNVEPDGKVRTDFNQVLTTGRISSSKPNMQQIPAKDTVGNKYRNAFVPPAGWSFVSGDYVSQELVVVAYLSGEKVWQEALKKGQDLHSICAEMVFGKKWKDASRPDCAYFKQVVNKDGKLEITRQKCSCPGHKHMRSGVKEINFGLIYGMSEFRLASVLRITVPESKRLFEDYFKTFPSIGKLLTFLGAFGVRNGYIKTIWPFYRRRWFPFWKHYKRFIDSHLMGAQYHPGLGEIERASKNMPIQGSSADMMKVALCLLYWEIHENGLEDRVNLKMQVHDQADTVARNDYREEWSRRQARIMNDAALYLIPNGLLKTDITITERWSK